MSGGSLAVLYAVVGAGMAVYVFHRSVGATRTRVAHAALALPLWPLWAPIALFGREERERVTAHGHRSLGRIEAALREGVEAARGSPLESLLSESSAERMKAEVARAAAREAELSALLARAEFDVEAAERRVARLETEGASPRALATARVHLENVRRLVHLADRDARALEDLAELAEALRTQLVLARYAGSSLEGIGGIVSEVWARVEGLGEAFEDAGGAARDR